MHVVLAAVRYAVAAGLQSSHAPAMRIAAGSGMRRWRCTALNDEIAGGVRADGRRRWAVDAILERQGPRGHVRWLVFDPATLKPWEDTWEPVTNLTADLRRAVRG